MSAWVKSLFVKYNADKAPAVLMPKANHEATFGIYNSWRAEARQQMGGTFEWSKVSEREMKSLSNKMFDAAEVPKVVRREYWSQYSKMMKKLKSDP